MTPSIGSHDGVPRVDRSAAFHARAHDRRVRFDARHGLALHVRSHERALTVVVFHERDERRTDGQEFVWTQRPYNRFRATSTIVGSPFLRALARSMMKRPVLESIGVVAGAVVPRSSMNAFRYMISFVTCGIGPEWSQVDAAFEAPFADLRPDIFAPFLPTTAPLPSVTSTRSVSFTMPAFPSFFDP